ncbi:uncharacterized protein [Ptychodera flava]|uniref:uncharacterized protein n=1 Tax=Ptychodera flava TaxID=63121 RepID=UPI00396A9546
MISLRLPRFVIILSTVIGVGSAYSLRTSNGLEVDLRTDGQYSIAINGEIWLNSAPTFFFVDGAKFSSPGNLKLLNISNVRQGADVLGAFEFWTLNWQADAKSGSKKIVTEVRAYKDLAAIVFSQYYPQTLAGTSIEFSEGVCTSWPAFRVEGKKGTKGYVSYGGTFLDDTKIGQWKEGAGNINFGLYGGPLAIFDKSLNTVVISSFSEFMAGSMQLMDGTINYGLMGSITQIPADFNFQTIVYYADGINKAIHGMGESLRKYYGKQGALRDTAFALNYIGYWTDGGAFYYYNTEPGKNYEETMLDVKVYTDSAGIPYRYFQLDSFWYFKGDNGGCKNWTAMPDVFPHGMQYLYDKIDLPMSAHNRWWTATTDYAKVNGGRWNFIVEKDVGYAIPQDAEFWNYLMSTSREWGLILYEQDWLNNEFEHMHATLQNVSVGRNWLIQMGQGAAMNDITILYCMPMARHILQSVEIPSVVTVRASGDYKAGNDQWKIGISSILNHAVGLAPFKDTFWTTTDQPGNKYHAREPYNELQAVVSTLSTGPVGPSDKIKYSNVSLIMRSCNTDGMLLKPSRPATSIDLQILQHSLGSGGPDGEVWSTYSDIASYRFGTLLWVNVETPYPITPQQAGFGKLPSNYAFSDRDPVKTLVKFDEENPLNQHKCGKADFGLWHTTPEITIPGSSRKVLILGELAKWVKMSPQRVLDIVTYTGDVIINLQGGVNEVIEFTVVYTDDLTTPHQIKCTVPESGRLQMHLSNEQCHPY